MDTKDGLVLQCVIESLTELGPEAEPAISALLLRYQNGDEFAGGEITEIAKAIGPSAIPILSAALTNNSTIIVAKAIECLGEIGTNACAAIPNLSSVLTNSFSTNALAAAYALRKITHANHGEVQTLLSLLDDENSQVRAGAIVVLGEFGTDASQAAEPLLRFLDPARPDIAGWTARTLGMIGPASRIAIPQLISLLNDRNPTNMIFVMEALGVFGENAKSAIPMLCAIADDPPEHQFGFIAIKTLGEIGADALPCLLSLYQKAKPDYSSLSKAITTMGSNAAPAVQVLIQELAADRPYPSAWAAMALGSIGASAKLAVPHLTELLRSANPHLRLRAAEALWRIDYQTNAVLAVMVSELTEWSRSPNALIGVESDSNNESRQQVAARVLGEIGPAAQDAIPLLQMLQRSSFAEQRTAAIEALRKISPGNY
jgi:HEAT repeat protein